MNTISILVRRSSEQLRQRLETKGAFLEKMPFRCCWSDCGSAGRLLLFIPEYPADSASQKALIETVASLLSRFIIEDLKVHLLHDLLRFYYFYFGREERQEILALACRDFESKAFQRCRELHRELIERSLQAYLGGSPVHLNIEGFYNFRMHEFRRELRRVLDNAVDSYLAEREYHEFVRLLKYFLNLQQPRIELLHLSVDAKGRFQVMDRCFKRVDPHDWEELAVADFDEESDYEDILVSMLVSVAPRRIMLHQNVSSRYPRAVKSLRSVFESRLIFCENCAYCRREKIHLVTGDSRPRPGTS
ncbi:MAG: putative sporulation protein YtxC [Dethiobacteria bacterium]|jgi:putative sporulation protein YtxC|nr:putative sporulation protein YtxC [Bacillota bacterium]HOB28935.1 putative sporulation protein YtxC [Bacillota bacterium]HPZ41499.1 putative sporulation protein YtxC [Bacillota bacterium]HQD52451.1 putative sporulation protein YtxC [Bacillota bacterium]